MLVLSEKDSKELLKMHDVIEALERAFRDFANGISQVAPRLTVRVPGAMGNLRILPAARVRSNDNLPPSPVYVGFKAYTGYVGPVFKDFSKPRFAVLLYNAKDGELLAFIAARWLGVMRTGGTAALATKYLYRGSSGTATIIGAGEQAVGQALGLSEIPEINNFFVYARNENHAKEFCETMNNMVKKEFRPVSDLQKAVEQSDLIVTVTTSREPVLFGKWLKDRKRYHINAVGANVENRRELDSDIVKRSQVVVEYLPQALEEAGDIIIPIREGLLRSEDILELGEIVAGKKTLNMGEKDITVFKSVGIALEDVAVAALLYEKAIQHGVGKQVEIL